MTHFRDLRTDKAVLREVGSRLKRRRLSLNLSQDFVAEEAGVSRSTLNRMERGDSIQLGSFLTILRVLDLDDRLEDLLAEKISPADQARLERTTRKRAATTKKSKGMNWFNS